MASQADVEVVRKAYEASNKGDMSSLEQLFSDEAVFYFSGNHSLSGEYRSKKAMFEMFGQMAQQTGGTMRVEIHDIVASNVGVVVLLSVHAERNGKVLEANDIEVSRVEDGKIVELRIYTSDQRAADEFFS
jgi:ketosteroid isomerase-like protein